MKSRAVISMGMNKPMKQDVQIQYYEVEIEHGL
jgi:hypothetical protein